MLQTTGKVQMVMMEAGNVQFQEKKYLYPPHGRSLEIPRGRGVLRVKILEAKYEAKLEFPWGWGV